MTKTCTKCGLDKSIKTDFAKDRRRRDNRTSACKVCINKRIAKWKSKQRKNKNSKFSKRHREDQSKWRKANPVENRDRHLKAKYGISAEGYDALLEEQDGLCAVCKRPAATFNKRLSVDHDHSCCAGKKSCGKCIRGLLCSGCNNGLGCFNDDPDRMASAIEYVKKKGRDGTT